MNGHTLRDLLTGRGWRLAAVVGVTLLVAVATVGAAGATTVRLATADEVSVSESTTVDVVVDDADGGVGAYNVTVALTNPSVASITNVELRGNPSEQTSRVAIDADGSSARMVAALADTADTGDVTIARVTIRGDGAGSTGLDLTVAALGDERGDSYTTETEAASLTILGSGAGTSGTLGDDSSDEAVTAESSADGTVSESQLQNTRVEVMTTDRGPLMAVVGLGLAALVALVAIRRAS